MNFIWIMNHHQRYPQSSDLRNGCHGAPYRGKTPERLFLWESKVPWHVQAEMPTSHLLGHPSKYIARWASWKVDTGSQSMLMRSFGQEFSTEQSPPAKIPGFFLFVCLLVSFFRVGVTIFACRNCRLTLPGVTTDSHNPPPQLPR